MGLVELIILLVVAAVCGAVAQAVIGFSLGGFLVSAGIGLIGGVVGTWFARAVNLPEAFMVRIGGTAVPLLWTMIGSMVFVAIAAVLSRRRVLR